MDSVWEDKYIGKEPTGFRLQNNHCYRNATFAAIFHLPQLLPVLDNHTAICDEDENPLCLVRVLAALAQEYWTSAPEPLRERFGALKDATAFINDFDPKIDRLRAKRLSADASREAITLHNAQKYHLGGLTRQNIQQIRDSQQDAEEFLRWVIRNLSHDAADFQLQGVLKQLLVTETQGSWKCDRCGARTLLRDGVRMTQRGTIPIVARDDHEVALKSLVHYLRQHWLRQQLELTCEECEQEAVVAESMKVAINTAPKKSREVAEDLLVTPEYLMLQVASFGTKIVRDKRGRENLVSMKHTSNARIPLWLDLKAFRHEEFELNERDDLRYKLWSTIYHQGGAYSGHYFGVFTGPCGVRRINNKAIHRAAAADLTKFYPYAARDEVGVSDDDGTNKRSEVPMFTKSQRVKNTDVEDRREAPYILIYKRINPAAQKAHVDAAKAASGLKRSRPLKALKAKKPKL